jgi:hypothetical protein
MAGHSLNTSGISIPTGKLTMSSGFSHTLSTSPSAKGLTLGVGLGLFEAALPAEQETGPPVDAGDPYEPFR